VGSDSPDDRMLGLQIDLTLWVPVIMAVLGLAVLVAYLTGRIPSGLGAASLTATLLVGVLVFFALVEALPFGKRLVVDFDRDDISAHAKLLLDPAAPLATLAAGLAFGYFFW
jgi:hypothetical protein